MADGFILSTTAIILSLIMIAFLIDYERVMKYVLFEDKRWKSY